MSSVLDARSYRLGMSAADRARDDGDFDRAAALYGHLAVRFPDDVGLLILRGNMFKDSGRLADARQSYGAAIARSPDNPDAHLQSGHLSKLEGDVEQAALSYLRSVSLNPGRPDAAMELRAIEHHLPLMTQRLDSTVLMSADPAGLLFERLKVAFATKPA